MHYVKDGHQYQPAGNLTPFPLGLSMHLVEWKRRHIAPEAGFYRV